MKKILSLALVMAFGVTVALAQSADAKPAADKTTNVEQATPVIKAVDVNQSDVKCASTTKSCCSNNASRTSAMTTTSTEAVTPEAAASTAVTTEAAPASSCHEVTVGMSAAKPEATEKTEEPKK